MNKLFKSLIFLFFFTSPSVLLAFDGDGLLLKSIAMNFDFSEYDQDGVVVNEEGILFGGELEIDKAWGPVWFSWNGQYLKGEVDYTGQAQDLSGNTRDHNTVTAETIIDTSFQIGRVYESWRRHDYAIIYFGGGLHQWARDIKTKRDPITDEPVIGLYERYSWLYLHMGARGFLFRTSNAYMMAELNLLRTFRPKMDVSFKGLADTDSVSLGEHYGAKLSIPFRYEVKRWFHIYSEIFFEAWDLGGSNKQLVKKNGFVTGTTFEEPRSTSRFYGAKLGVFLKFD